MTRMWNQALRRIVQAEERDQEDRRRQQLAHAAFTLSCASVDTSTSSKPAVEASQSVPEEPLPVPTESSAVSSVEITTLEPSNPVENPTDEVEDDDDDNYQQQHLLSRPTSVWTCLEDTQQANCLALNASETLLAVGERDGRVTIWDNTTIRVITRELDPTLIALPTIESPKGTTNMLNGQNESLRQAKEGEIKVIPSADESIENDDRSVEEEDDEEEDDDDEEEEMVSIEEEQIEEEAKPLDELKTEEETSKPIEGAILTLADLQVVKTALKIVSQCAWSCDSRWLCAGCDEKATRRARLCVWDVEAATLVAAFQFDGPITALSAHPRDPQLLLVSYWNARPVVLNLVSGERTELDAIPLDNTDILPSTAQTAARHAILASCARYGRSGRRIYCATSRSTVAVLDASTFQCLDRLTLTVGVQFVDLCVNVRETALLLTSSKGIHEFQLISPFEIPTTATTEHPLWLEEVALHSTGAVRAPWAVCCFSGDEDFVVGTPVVRHRHVGENGLFTWHRAYFRGKPTAQHNVGVKDGVLALVWDRGRDSVLAVSTSGSLYVLEEQFSTTWPGAMYPAGFRLITDNEKYLEVFDQDENERKREKQQRTEAAKAQGIDVFTITNPQGKKVSEERDEVKKRWYIPAIPIAHYHRRVQFQVSGQSWKEEKEFGLGQSVLEPLKSGFTKVKKTKKTRTEGTKMGGKNSKNTKRRRR